MRPLAVAGVVAAAVAEFIYGKNQYLEEAAVKLLNIKPHHKVLEIGYGKGNGLKAACTQIKAGIGQVSGVDVSLAVTERASRHYKQLIAEGALDVIQGHVCVLPCNSDEFDRVFHVNCFYFWDDIDTACDEMYRVMKSDSLMVTTMDLTRLKHRSMKKFLKTGNTDTLRYMHALENVGFQNVQIKYYKEKGKTLEAIFAEKKTVTTDTREMNHDSNR